MAILDNNDDKQPINHNKYQKPSRINALSLEESIQLQKRQKQIEEEMRLKFLTNQMKVQNDSDVWKTFRETEEYFSDDDDDSHSNQDFEESSEDELEDSSP
ncbi:13747_t:CDS:2, partial [Acaulospora colombiana]